MSVKKTIGIFTAKVSGVDPWDPDSIQAGVTGSEEAVIYISTELAHLGYRVLVFGDPPTHSRYSHPSENPRFVDLSFRNFPTLDIAISWRMPTIAEDLKRVAKRVYFWPHDVCMCHLTEKQINGFDDVLWLSQWQRNHWTLTNPGLLKFKNIFGNGINLQPFSPIKKRENPFSCIYGSNYARGLEVLLEIWPEVKSQFPQSTLDIYYGWQTFGLLPAEKRHRCVLESNSSLLLM